jgi:RNA polymerase sigma-70 factor, ECF subfamily
MALVADPQYLPAVVIALPVEIDMANADRVGQQLGAALAPGVATVIADMTATRFCDSSGLSMLVRAHGQAAANGTELRLVVASAAVLRTLTLVGLDRLLPIYPSLSQALPGTLSRARCRGWLRGACWPGFARCAGAKMVKLLRPVAGLPILGPVIGDGFEAVLAAAQGGSEAAFSRLWRDGNPALLRYLRVMVPEAAEDVAADTWVQVVRGLAAFRGDEQAWRGWLFTTARRRAFDERRRRMRRPVAPLAEVASDRLPACPDAADVAIEHLATRSAMALVARLPALQAEVILLRVVAGLDNDMVARLTGRSPGAVRVAAHRGLRRLAQIMAETGVTL